MVENVNSDSDNASCSSCSLVAGAPTECDEIGELGFDEIVELEFDEKGELEFDNIGEMGFDEIGEL